MYWVFVWNQFKICCALLKCFSVLFLLYHSGYSRPVSPQISTQTSLRNSSLRNYCHFSGLFLVKLRRPFLVQYLHFEPFEGCKALDLTSYFFSNILPYETNNRPKLSKYRTLSLIKGCAKKRLKPIREKTHFLSCIRIVLAVIYAVKLWSKISCFVFD